MKKLSAYFKLESKSQRHAKGVDVNVNVNVEGVAADVVVVVVAAAADGKLRPRRLFVRLRRCNNLQPDLEQKNCLNSSNCILTKSLLISSKKTS